MSNPSPIPDHLLDSAEATEYLGVRRSWVRDAVSVGRVPHTRIGRHVRFGAAHLAASSPLGSDL